MEKEINHLGVSKEEDSCLEQATLQLHPMKKKNGFLRSLGGGECPCFILIFLQVFANQGRKGQKNGDGEKGGELCVGGIHTKIEREEERPAFLGTPLFVYL